MRGIPIPNAARVEQTTHKGQKVLVAKYQVLLRPNVQQYEGLLKSKRPVLSTEVPLHPNVPLQICTWVLVTKYLNPKP